MNTSKLGQGSSSSKQLVGSEHHKERGEREQGNVNRNKAEHNQRKGEPRREESHDRNKKPATPGRDPYEKNKDRR